ncbi:MAG: hypothetical protein HP049_03305 [Clostridiales bacterium]|nr:hypothetical protein [Clostridiales bacterium]
MQTFFQTLRTWCAEGGTTFVCAETAMRVLLAACFADARAAVAGELNP